MQFKDTLRVLILSAVSSLIVFSCITVDKSIGIDNVPLDQELNLSTKTFALPVGMRSLDSIQGVSDEYMVIGSFMTQEYGEANFGCAGNIAPQYTGYNFGRDAKITSVYLAMPLAESTGDKNSSLTLDPSQEGIPQNINVYRLKTTLDTTTIFCNSIKEEDYDPTPVNKTSITYFGGDTLRVYLNNSFGEEILASTEEELDSLGLFSQRHKGLYITCDSPVSTVNGGRLNLFEYGTAYIYVKFNFQPTWEEGLSRKDTTIRLVFGYNYALNTSSYSSKGMETYLADKSLYIEGMGGIAPFIEAKALKEMLDSWCTSQGYDPSKVVVAKATLSFPFEEPGNPDMYSNYPSYLFPTRRLPISETSSTKYYYLCTDYNSTGNTYGAMNRALMKYEADFPYTIQEIINMDKAKVDSSYDIWIYPLTTTETQNYYGYTSIAYLINNYTYYNAKINGPGADRYPELKLVYTVIK